MRFSKLLQTSTPWISTSLFLLSLMIYWRGHQLPGGGFVGGLVASTGLVLHALGRGTLEARQILLLPPEKVSLIGLLVAIFSAWLGPLTNGSFFQGVWSEEILVNLSSSMDLAVRTPALGSPMLFDLGVYLVVLGFVSSMFLKWLEVEA